MTVRRILQHLLLFAALLPAACSGGDEDGTLRIAFIDASQDGIAGDLRLSSGARHMRAATEEGLVGFNAAGDVIPGLADRWIVTDDGMSFIFRLRDGTWPDGSELTAESVESELVRLIRQLDDTEFGLDLAPIRDVRAMAGQVVEIRLSSPAPTLLQLLAQPELALVRDAGGTGDMLLEQRGRDALLTLRPPLERGLPEEEDWQEEVRPIVLTVASAREALDGFDDGTIDLVLGGTLGTWPLVDTGPLSLGTVQMDPALGLFGLRVRHDTALLEDAPLREAIAMAIDRPALIEPFGIGGWLPTTRVVPPDLPGDPGYILERWEAQTIEERREVAGRRIAAWRSANDGAPARLTVALDSGPGYDLLFRQLAAQLATIGVTLERAADPAAADLLLVDRVARYAEPRWFLNQFHCLLRRGLCVDDVDFLVEQANVMPDAAARATLLAEAEAELLLSNLYIPFGQPLRWSLVRSGIDGFTANPWAFHPLPPLAELGT